MSKTVVRGGIGLYYEIFVGGNYQNSTQQNGVAQTGAELFDFSTATIAANQTPAYAGALPGTSTNFSGGGNIVTIAPNFKTPSVVNSSLQIDQQIAKGTILTIGTLWSHGMHLTASSAYDENLKPPSGTTTYSLPSGSTVVGPNLGPAIVSPARKVSSRPPSARSTPSSAQALTTTTLSSCN